MRISLRSIVVKAAATLVCTVAAIGQTSTKSQRPDYLDSGKVPTFAEPLLRAIGDRLTIPGKERLSIVGTLTDSNGPHLIRVLLELPMKGRVEYLGLGGATLTLDGDDKLQSSKTGVTEQDFDLVESLIADRQESLLYGLAQGDGARLVGRGFPLISGQGKNYRGPVFDLIDITSKTAFRSGSPQRFRRCYFDSATGLLHKVQYTQLREGKPVTVETFVRDWIDLLGQRTPKVIERREDGKVVFSILITEQGLLGKATDGVFGK